MQAFEFDLKYTTREITAWGGLALLKRMMDGMGLRQAVDVGHCQHHALTEAMPPCS